MADVSRELDWIADHLKVQSKLGPVSIAILCRTQSDIRRVTEKLDACGIPCSTKFSSGYSPPILGSSAPLNFLKLICNPKNDIAFLFSLDGSIFFNGLKEVDMNRFVIKEGRNCLFFYTSIFLQFLFSQIRRRNVASFLLGCFTTMYFGAKTTFTFSRSP